MDDGSDACSLDVGDEDNDEEEDGEEEDDEEEEMREDDEEGSARVGSDKQMVDVTGEGDGGAAAAAAAAGGMIGDSSRAWKGDANGEKPAADSGRSSRSSLRSNPDAVDDKITVMQSVVIRSKVMYYYIRVLLIIQC